MIHPAYSFLLTAYCFLPSAYMPLGPDRRCCRLHHFHLEDSAKVPDYPSRNLFHPGRRPNSFWSEVTPLSRNPQGTIQSK